MEPEFGASVNPMRRGELRENDSQPRERSRLLSGRMIGIFALTLVMGLTARAVLLSLAGGGLDEAIYPGDYPGAAPRPEDLQRLALLRDWANRTAALDQAKRRAGRNGWMAAHPEEGAQTFMQFYSAALPAPSATRTTIYVQPWGDFTPLQWRIVELTGEMIETFYGLSVKVLERRALSELPAFAVQKPHAGEPDRYLAAPFLERLESSRPSDGFAVIGLTAVDLSPRGGSTWVFGEAVRGQGIAICSLARQGDPNQDFTLCLRRTLKTVLHETGHTIGIDHCTVYECDMNGSRSRAEADSRPLWFCAQDEMKVWWSSGVDPAPRYRALAEFAARNALSEEAKFWTESSRALETEPAAR
jgi:archaemetzincin